MPEDRLISAKQAIAKFQENERLQAYFDIAVAYAIYPTLLRAGMGFSGAYGSGWVFRGEVVEGKTRVLQISAGIQVIAEAYRHIIIFETEEAYQCFRDSELKFAWQVNAALVLVGTSLTPASRICGCFQPAKSGAGLETSVSGQRSPPYLHFTFLSSGKSCRLHCLLGESMLYCISLLPVNAIGGLFNARFTTIIRLAVFHPGLRARQCCGLPFS